MGSIFPRESYPEINRVKSAERLYYHSRASQILLREPTVWTSCMHTTVLTIRTPTLCGIIVRSTAKSKNSKKFYFIRHLKLIAMESKISFPANTAGAAASWCRTTNSHKPRTEIVWIESARKLQTLDLCKLRVLDCNRVWSNVWNILAFQVELTCIVAQSLGTG